MSLTFKPPDAGPWKEIYSDPPFTRLETLRCNVCPFEVEMRTIPRFHKNSALPRFSMARGIMRRHIKLNHSEAR